MKTASYGQASIAPNPTSWLEEAAEEILVRGYTILTEMFSPEELKDACVRLDTLYRKQAEEFGLERLAAIGDTLTVRAPVLEDPFFLRFATHERLLALLEHVLQGPVLLYLQNGILNNGPTHPQSRWHRDLPYQHWLPNRPVAINALYALDDFRADNGATLIVPYSHRMDPLPSWQFMEKNAVAAIVPAGSVLVFDSWLWHRAGDNQAGTPRRALNHIFTTPIFLPVYDFRPLLARQPDPPSSLRVLLGETYQTAVDGRAWREARAARLQNR